MVQFQCRHWYPLVGLAGNTPHTHTHTHTHTHMHTHTHTGMVLSVILFFCVKSDKPPHWTLQAILGVLAFVMSIAWLNIEANEVVAVLQAFGLLFGIDTGVLDI